MAIKTKKLINFFLGLIFFIIIGLTLVIRTYYVNRLLKFSININDILIFNNFTLLIIVMEALILSLITIFSLLSFYNKLEKDLTSIEMGTKAIGSGNLEYIIKSNKNDEIGLLVNSFNLMSSKLRDSYQKNQHLASFHSLNPNPVIELDYSGGIIMFNKAALDLIKSIEGKNDISVYIPGDIGEIINEFKEKKRTLFYREIRILIFTFEEMIFFPPGINFIRIYPTDISEQKLLQKILRDNEEKYRLLYSSMSEGAALFEAVLDENGKTIDFRFLDINDSLLKMFDLNRNEVIGRTITNFIGSDLLSFFFEATNDNHPKSFEYYLKVHNRYFNFSVYSPKKGQYAGIVSDITERKSAEFILRNNEERYRDLVSGMNSGLIVYDALEKGEDFIIKDINPAALAIDNLKKDNAIGKSILKLFPVIKENGLLQVIQRVWKTGISERFPIFYFDIGFTKGWRDIFIYKLSSGEIVTLYDDVTVKKEAEDQIKTSLSEKETLLKEIHHRVKNNLQIISSLLHLQESYISDPQAINVFRDSQNRVKSMAIIHEKLYQSKDLSNVDFKSYIQNLTASLYNSYGINYEKIKLVIKSGNIMFNIDTAITVGLLLNEILSNCFKHAFPDGKVGMISINLRKRGKSNFLSVKDNGIGMPRDIDRKKINSLGIQLIFSLSQQLEGKCYITSGKGGFQGTEFKIVFPI